jgi:hypothetical protein
MTTRRDFLKTSSLLVGTGAVAALPLSTFANIDFVAEN